MKHSIRTAGAKKRPSSALTLANLKNFAGRLYRFWVEPEQCSWRVALALLVAEMAINWAVIEKVPYTEIDWVAYMQEVAGVVGKNGTLDYSALKGDTGPLVYPAGFVWVYSALYWLCDEGRDVRRAQFVFAGLYLATLALVFRLLHRTLRMPNYCLALMALTSYRIHSIFVLRLFNDPVAMAFLYAALNVFIDAPSVKGRIGPNSFEKVWIIGSVLYSLAVSVKMNILLFAPALLLTYLAALGPLGTMVNLAVCGAVQLLVGLPFLTSHPVEYLRGSFDVSRVFQHRWTVNWRFVPEDIFVGRPFHLTLLCGHILLLALMAPKWWASLKRAFSKEAPGPERCRLVLKALFSCNLIGMAFARSLHYQFYCWYFHQLHFLLFSTRYPTNVRLLVLALIEVCWNVYPSTAWSSACLHVCHLAIVLGWAFFDLDEVSHNQKRSKRA